MILFDGVCNLCNAYVNFVIDRDPTGYFTFGTLQSSAAAPYVEACDLSADALETVVLIEDGHCYLRSTAVLRILRRLGAPWSWLYGIVVIPKPLRDAVYNFVARIRYPIFGQRTECRVPTPDLRSRFLEDGVSSALSD